MMAILFRAGGKAMRQIVIGCVLLALCACAPKVGSREWCEAMDKKAKADWSSNEAADYAKHCILRGTESN
jgi:hypothetical protein